MSIFDLLIVAVTGAVMVVALRGMLARKAEATKERYVATTFPDQFSSATSDEFRFAPELFELRTNVIESLDAQGFAWFSHYSSVDCLHDVYGIEVCGIKEHEDAVSILRILVQMFPDWKPG
jgi:hypothetical protein